MICTNCKRELPEEQFEMCKTGTRRKVCRHCHYVLHTKRAWKKWWRRLRARDNRGNGKLTRLSRLSHT